MGWFTNTLKDAAGSLLGAGASALGGGLAGQALGGSPSLGRNMNQEKRLIKLGNKYDLINQKEMYDFRLGRMEEAGLTSVEMFGSPGSAPGGGTTGSGTTLGNAASSQAIANKQIEKDRQLAWQKTIADNATSLQQTKMQTDAQKEIASQQVGATTRGQDIQKAIAEGRLELDRDTYHLNVKTASANIRKTEQETAKLINEVATSDAKFVTAMKQLSMGPANLLVELTMRHHGIALNDNSFKSLPKEKREAILAQILALSSSTYTEGKGAAALGKGAVEGGSGVLDSIISIISNPIGLHEGIEAAPSLGKPRSKMSEPFRPGPNMSYR